MLLHVAWFVNPIDHPVRWDLVISSRTALGLGASTVALAGAFFLQKMLGDRHWPRLPFLGAMAVGAPTLVAVQAAITLIYSGVQPVLLAPHLHVHPTLAAAVIGLVEVGIGFSYLTGLGDRVASVLLLLLVLATFILYSPLDALAQVHWLGLAAVVFVIGRQATQAGRPRRGGRPLPRIDPGRAVAALRVLTGVAIMAPALSEKIWNPGIGRAFLQQHQQFNVVQHLLGVSWFSDDLFVLAAGVAELTIGVLLISGLLTRLVIIAMWLPFNLTVPFLPPQELIWHIPILGIIYFLLVHGADLAPDSRAQGPASPAAT